MSLDLAVARWRDVGVVALERHGARVAAVPVRPAEGERLPPPAAADVAAWADRLARELGATLLLLDGPCAWKAPETGLQHQRVAERALATQGKTGLPGQVKPGPMLGFVGFAIAVFDALEDLGWPRWNGTALARGACAACETYPTAAWRALGHRPLPGKARCRKEPGAVEAWSRILEHHHGVAFTDPPSHDELQAAVAGLAGLALAAGTDAWAAVGSPLRRLDDIPREGYILQPARPPLTPTRPAHD